MACPLDDCQPDKMEPLSVNIFIPNYTVRTREPGFLFGYMEQVEPSQFVNANITTLLPFASVTDDLNVDNLLFDFMDTKRDGCIRYLGVITTEEYGQPKPWHGVAKLQKYFTELYRDLKITLWAERWPSELDGYERAFQLKSFMYHGRLIHDMRNINLAFYYPQDVLTSRFMSRLAAEDGRIGFVAFINDTIHQTALQWKAMTNLIDNMAHEDEETTKPACARPRQELVVESNPWTRFLTFDHLLILSSMFFLFSPKYTEPFLYHMKQCSKQAKNNFTCNIKFFVKLHRFIDMLEAIGNHNSVVFSQIRFKVIQMSIVCQLWYEVAAKRVSLALGNAFFALLFDMLLGHIVFWLLYHCVSASDWIDYAAENLVIISDNLMILLDAMKSMPLGLKLNCPLNNFLANLLIYHVYLWKNYLTVIKPVFVSFCHLMIYSNLIGLTFPICMLSDLFSLLTIHTYFFYGYISIIYKVQVSTIVHMFRLFRGKKYNPQRDRIDSYVYDTQQMFLGVVFFTICIFLVPTVLMYYTVFTVFRIISLATKETIFSVIDYISPLPVYSILLRMLNSPMIAGGLYALKFPYLATEPHDNVELDSDELEKPQVKRPCVMMLCPNQPSIGKLFEYRYDLILMSLATQRAIFCGAEFNRHKFVECLITGNQIYHRFPYFVSAIIVAVCVLFWYYSKIN